MEAVTEGVSKPSFSRCREGFWEELLSDSKSLRRRQRKTFSVEGAVCVKDTGCI